MQSLLLDEEAFMTPFDPRVNTPFMAPVPMSYRAM